MDYIELSLLALAVALFSLRPLLSIYTQMLFSFINRQKISRRPTAAQVAIPLMQSIIALILSIVFYQSPTLYFSFNFLLLLIIIALIVLGGRYVLHFYLLRILFSKDKILFAPKNEPAKVHQFIKDLF